MALLKLKGGFLSLSGTGRHYEMGRRILRGVRQKGQKGLRALELNKSDVNMGICYGGEMNLEFDDRGIESNG